MTICPNCARPGLRPFYQALPIPAHSVLLLHTRDRAMAYPRGDLQLGHCPACGFITNLLFDVTLNEYSSHCEETQHCSPVFDTWARHLVDRLVHDYHVQDRRIVEIGCGKGEFLELLCQAGNNIGVGIDPGCDPNRLRGPAASRVTLIQDRYSERYAALPADVVCCRHTLEHIQPTLEFMRMIRRGLGRRSDTLVFFEVPDATRVLRERAFWDIYYEHCSYFTAGSLARLFRAAGFELIELVRDFSDQYLWATARPADAPTAARLGLEADLDDIERDVRDFQEQCPYDIAGWRDRIGALATAGRRPVVWGAGSKCVAFLTTAGIGSEIEYVVDINPRKAGTFLPGTGHPVMAPEFLVQYRPQSIIAMNPVYRDEIAGRLASLGVEAEIIAAENSWRRLGGRTGDSELVARTE